MWFMFWKERYFVVITAAEENERVRQTVFQLGKAIARDIPHTAPLPSLLKALPTAGTQIFHGRGPHHWDPRYVCQYKGSSFRWTRWR